MNGNSEFLRYIDENARDWDWDVCQNAAMNGNLDCLRYVNQDIINIVNVANDQ